VCWVRSSTPNCVSSDLLPGYPACNYLRENLRPRTVSQLSATGASLPAPQIHETEEDDPRGTRTVLLVCALSNRNN
jgi:hypothetical protein